MIIALPKWDDPNAFYLQTNNPTEEVIRKAKAEMRIQAIRMFGEAAAGLSPGWLETCGCTAAVNVLAAKGLNLSISCPGGTMLQPEEALADWLNDPTNYPLISRHATCRPDQVFGNRIPQYYPAAIMAVFGIPSRFEATKSTEAELVEFLRACKGTMLCLDSPGHFIAVVGYDTDTREFIYHDSWPGNQWPEAMAGKSGRCRRVAAELLEKNLKPARVVI